MGRAIFSGRLLLVVRVLVLAAGALALFALTALAWLLALAWLGAAPGAVARSVLCGLVVWLFIAVFHVRREQTCLPFAERGPFLDRLRAELADLGYEPGPATPHEMTFRPRFTAFLFGGAVRVRVGTEQVTLRGPRVFLERLRERLRLHKHVGTVHPATADLRPRPSKPPLRRVQIGMTLHPEEMAGVCRNVVDLLQREGAEVACEVAVVARSDAGILDSTIEGVVREWLRRRDIPATIHKEPIPAESRKPNALACAAEHE